MYIKAKPKSHCLRKKVKPGKKNEIIIIVFNFLDSLCSSTCKEVFDERIFCVHAKGQMCTVSKKNFNYILSEKIAMTMYPLFMVLKGLG